MLHRTLITALLLTLSAAPVQAQRSFAAQCHNAFPPTAGAVRATCVAAAQAAVSAQPQLSVLIAGGNPTLGSAGTGGLRLGLLPRVNAGVQLNTVFARFPDVRAGGNGAVTREFHAPTPALAATASLGLYNGVNLAPGIGGFGAVDLLGSAAWLPFRVQSADLAYGLGARVGLLRESFILPAASLSLVRHHLGRVGFGDVCPAGEISTAPPGGACLGGGDPAEFAFDLTTWSARAVVSKQLFGLGAAAGVGYDRSSSDMHFAVRVHDPEFGVTRVFRATPTDVSQGRWSLFANGSYSLLIARVAVEAGWLQGGDALREYSGLDARYDPTNGSFFGSVGVRVGL